MGAGCLADPGGVSEGLNLGAAVSLPGLAARPWEFVFNGAASTARATRCASGAVRRGGVAGWLVDLRREVRRARPGPETPSRREGARVPSLDALGAKPSPGSASTSRGEPQFRWGRRGRFRVGATTSGPTKLAPTPPSPHTRTPASELRQRQPPARSRPPSPGSPDVRSTLRRHG
ncbi:hypothetical protein GT021_31890 [Streptomyces sp. SID5470]|nr:hypothetical protein [Streptomyces sp. SID5470]